MSPSFVISHSCHKTHRHWMDTGCPAGCGHHRQTLMAGVFALGSESPAFSWQACLAQRELLWSRILILIWPPPPHQTILLSWSTVLASFCTLHRAMTSEMISGQSQTQNEKANMNLPQIQCSPPPPPPPPPPHPKWIFPPSTLSLHPLPPPPPSTPLP